jgi:hypothetical protein
MDNLGYEGFRTEVNTKFSLTETELQLELIEVNERNISPRQEMFSLIFRGPKDCFLEQRIYRLHHEKLGAGQLFLVPIGQDADWYIYEASFNRLKSE